MKQKELKKWEEIRKQGEKNYVWKRGVLNWGFVAVGYLLYVILIRQSENPLIRAVLALLLFPLGGYVWAKWTWRVNEKRYLKAVNQSGN